MSQHLKSSQVAMDISMPIPAVAMSEFEQILLSNSGEDAFESAIKLMAAKLLDEHRQESGDDSLFRIHSTPQKTHDAIQLLYAQALDKWPYLKNGSNELGISPSHLVRSIRPLLNWKLRGSDLSWMDATLERLVARDSKGALGQYFTPRDIVKMCVEILNPGPNEHILDPACGSGGFLFEAYDHSVNNYGKQPKCLGIDFSQKSVKVATLLSVATSGNGIVVSKGNSIDGHEYEKYSPKEWNDFLQQERASTTQRAMLWGNWNKLGCDVLLTNPPFAGDIDDSNILAAYESQLGNGTKRTVSREHLFLERAVDLLKPKGRMAVVLPQGVLANSTTAYLRMWLLKKCRIISVIGLHPYAFLPYTGVKTAVLIAEKAGDGTHIPEDYPIMFAVSRAPGKDSSGRTVGESDYASIGSQIAEFIAAENFCWASTKKNCTNSCVNVEKVMLSEVQECCRLDAEHYEHGARMIERHLTARSEKRIGGVINKSINRFKRREHRQISYVDISSVDKKTGLAFPETVLTEEAPSRASYLIRQGDVLVSTVRPDSNVVALITGGGDAPMVASNGFCVLRPESTSSEYLYAYCKTEAFKKMLSIHATASMYPTVNDKDIHALPFVEPDQALQDEVVDLVQSGLRMIEQAQQQIQRAITLVNTSLAQDKEN